MVFGVFIILVIIAIKTLKFIFIANKISKESIKRKQKERILAFSNKKSAGGDNFYNINITTNSNLIALNESSQLSYETKEFYRKIQEKELKLVDFQNCQYCGSLSNTDAEICFYCGNSLKS